MELKKNRLIFLAIWLFVIFSGPITVLASTPLKNLFGTPDLMVYTFQRLTGLVAFSLLFIQIILGANMGIFLQKLGARSYFIHTTQGLIAYAFIVLHPLLNSAFLYMISENLTYALTSLLPTAADQRELYINLGRLALVLVTLGVGVSRLRTKALFRKYWLYFHWVNYIAFYLVFAHARFIGSDTFSFPFVIVFYSAFLLVTYSLASRLLGPFFTKMNNQGRISKY